LSLRKYKTKDIVEKIAIEKYQKNGLGITIEDIEGNDLLYASRMAAKVDNAAIQDGYSLYHHVILFDQHGDWTIIQQGMNPINRMARRYHWISDNCKSFTLEPHSGIISLKVLMFSI